MLTVTHTRFELVSDLAAFYACDPRLFWEMADATLERAWRVVQNHLSFSELTRSIQEGH